MDDVYDFSIGDIFIIDDYSPPGGYSNSDKFWKSTGGLWSQVAFPAPWGSLNVRLWDTSATVFADTSLPTSLDLNDFDVRDMEIVGLDENGVELYRIFGPITSCTVIPAPSTLVGLISMGIMVALGWVWRRRKRAR